MNPLSEAEQRLYEQLSEMTGSRPTIEPEPGKRTDLTSPDSGEVGLNYEQRLYDPGTRRCLSFVLDGKGNSDDFLQCYDGQDEPTDAVEERGLSSDEKRMYEEFSEMMDVPIRPTEARTVDVERRVIVPRSLIETINRSYAEIARAGFLTEGDFEEKLHAWLAESSGA